MKSAPLHSHTNKHTHSMIITVMGLENKSLTAEYNVIQYTQSIPPGSLLLLLLLLLYAQTENVEQLVT